MKEWTVLGYYEDTGQIWTQHIQYLLDEQAAIAEAVKGVASPDTLIVLGVFEGSQIIRPTSEDTGTGAYAVDLMGEEG